MNYVTNNGEYSCICVVVFSIALRMQLTLTQINNYMMKTFYITNRFRTRLIFLVWLILLLNITNVFAKGIIQGVVRDAVDSIPLPAATVVIKGTSTGTITNQDGAYSLSLKAGNYVIEYSYLGYDSKEKEISINDDDIITLDVSLSLSDFTGEAIIITAQARGQLAAMNKQINSNQIVNSVAAEKIKEFPDENAAQSISRLPGVTLSGSSVVIRGAEPKMNKILINGVEMPSTDADNRSVSLDMISSNILSGIDVYKSVTPDMDADAIGGVVNLRLQEAPKGLHYSILTQGSYNMQEMNGNLKLWADISNRFFDNKLGIELNLNYDFKNGGYDNVDMGYTSESEGKEYMFTNLKLQDKVQQTKSYGGSLILDYQVGNGKVVFNSMLSHKYDDQLVYTDNISLIAAREFHLSHQGYYNQLWNNFVQFDQQLGRFKINAMASYISYDNKPDYQYEYQFNTSGNGTSSVSNADRKLMDPYEIYDYVIDTAWQNARMKYYTWEPEKFNENRFVSSFDVEAPFSITSWLNMKLKAGIKYQQMERDRSAEGLRYGDDIGAEGIQSDFSDWLVAQGQTDWNSFLSFKNFRDYDHSSPQNFMNSNEHYKMPYVLNVDLMDEMALNLIDNSKLQETEDWYTKRYWGGERLYAGYFMAVFNFWNRLMILPGFRYESLANDYSAFYFYVPTKNNFMVKDTLNRPVTHNNFLPHLHTKLSVTNWFDIRFSYNKTLTRPDYNFIIPYIRCDISQTAATAGNPNLKPAVSENLDLNFSFHSDKLGLITIGGYTKDIEGIFYSQETMLKNIPDSLIIAQYPTETYPAFLNTLVDFYINNPNNAYIKGLEFEWQSNLTWLPQPFNGLVLNVNYTHVWSETKYVENRVISKPIPTYPFRESVEVDTFFVGRLVNQANDLGNISIGYDYKGFSARLSFRFQGNVMGSPKAIRVETDYTNNSYKFDLSLKQQIPVKFARMELFFNAINFTNVPSGRYCDYPNKGKTITRSRYTGCQLQLGVRLRNKI